MSPGLRSTAGVSARAIDSSRPRLADEVAPTAPSPGGRGRLPPGRPAVAPGLVPGRGRLLPARPAAPEALGHGRHWLGLAPQPLAARTSGPLTWRVRRLPGPLPLVPAVPTPAVPALPPAALAHALEPRAAPQPRALPPSDPPGSP